MKLTDRRYSILKRLPVVAIGAVLAGCVSMAERVGTGLAEKDLKSLEQEFKLFDTDLALFRGCLTERGGSCQGDHTTALPHSSEDVAAQAIAPVAPGASQTLAESVARLPDDHAAKSALAVMNHPVVGQATALHNHLRGHGTGDTQGFSVAHGTGSHGGPESTAVMEMKVSDVHHFHRGLLSSLGTTAWESLHGHCAALLAAQPAGPDRRAPNDDCRRVAFIRGYLEAYTRTGEFIEVDVQLAGAIHAVNEGSATITHKIERLSADLQAIETDAARMDTAALQRIGSDAGKVSGDVTTLVANVEDKLVKRFGSTAIFTDLKSLARQIDTRSDALAQAAGRGLSRDVSRVASELDDLMQKLGTRLQTLENRVAGADRRLVEAINTETGKADATLSNVFKVSTTGFVSRNHEFRASLPTLRATFDPTVDRLLTFTDTDTGQALSSKTNFRNLGVATDTSGVGTGTLIGAEIVRVFLEAIFDAHEGLPAVAPANAADVKPTGVTLGEYSLRVFTSPMGNIDSRDLTHMLHTNDQIAAKTRAILSRIVAGIGPISLNNRSLETFIVEVVTTSVREATAKASWCWYACNLDVELKQAEADAITTAEAEAQQVGNSVKARAKKEAEHVKLRFGIIR